MTKQTTIVVTGALRVKSFHTLLFAYLTATLSIKVFYKPTIVVLIRLTEQGNYFTLLFERNIPFHRIIVHSLYTIDAKI